MVFQSLQTFLENEASSGWDVVLHFQKTHLANLNIRPEISLVLKKREPSVVAFTSTLILNCTIACQQNICEQVSRQLQQKIANWVEASKHQRDERVVSCQLVEQAYTPQSIGIQHYSCLLKLKLQVITPKT